MRTAPPDPLHFCRLGRQAIFLDIQANRYFALPESLNTAFLEGVGDCAMGIVPRDGLTALEAGVPAQATLDGIAGIQETGALPAASTDGKAEQNLPRIPAGMYFKVIAVALMAKALVRLCPLHWLLTNIERVPPRKPQPSGTQVIAQLGRAFEWLHLITGKDGNCLPFTLAFVWLGRRLGCNSARLVIGVRINPFSAHCWCQDGAVVLNDRYDNVRTYQPILIL